MRWYHDITEAGYPSKKETRYYYLARLLQQKNPRQSVDAIVDLLKSLSPEQLDEFLAENGVQGNELIKDPNFGIPYSVPPAPVQPVHTRRPPEVPQPQSTVPATKPVKPVWTRNKPNT